MADGVTQIRAAGPVGAKKNLAVIGDGFAAADQGTFNTWVNDVLLSGVFVHDLFYEDASAWNIFRVNLESVDSGVSTKVYDEHGTPADPSDDTVTSQNIRDTALGIIYSGSWAHCWLEYGTDSENRLQKALKKWVPDYQFVSPSWCSPVSGTSPQHITALSWPCLHDATSPSKSCVPPRPTCFAALAMHASHQMVGSASGVDPRLPGGKREFVGKIVGDVICQTDPMTATT